MFRLLLISFSLFFHGDASSKEIEINFIKDFLAAEFYSVQVNAYVCWNINDNMNLAETLFNENIHISIHNTSLKNPSHFKRSPEILFVIDSSCEISANILFLANMQNLFASPYNWLLLSTYNNFEEFRKNNDIDELDILIDSSFYLGEKISDTEYSLNEIFKFNKTGELHNRVIDIWTNGSGFNNHSIPTILSTRRQNIMGTKIVGAAVILDNNTYNHLYDYREKQEDSITKLNIRLVNIMIEYFNGTKGFEFFDSWGYKKPTETFYTGMIGALQTGDADIGCTSMFVNTERLQAVDYMSWTTPTAIQFIYKQPPLSYVSNLFTLPFSRTVWFSILGLFFLAVVLIYIVTLWERKHMDDRPEEDDSLLEIIMLAVGAVCQQGTTYEPKSGTGKIITFLIFVALLFVYTSYSAYIVVLLQSVSTDIETLEDLLNSKMDYGLSDMPYNKFYFENATEPIRKLIYQKKIKPKGDKVFMTLDDGIKRVRNGFFAFHHETPPMYTVIGDTFYEDEKCGLQTLQYIEASQFWLPCRKDSSFKEIFKVSLRKLAEVGIQSRESSRLFDSKPKCLGGGNNFVSVGLVDAGPAFAFLGAGFGVSMLLFILEYVVHRCTCFKLHRLRKKSR